MEKENEVYSNLPWDETRENNKDIEARHESEDLKAAQRDKWFNDFPFKMKEVLMMSRIKH